MPDNEPQMTLVAVGDVDGSGDDADRKFDLVRSVLQEADITFGQLEYPLANSGEQQLAGGSGFQNANSATKKDPRRSARVLADAGFNVMSHAGNHVMDLGEQNMFETMDAIASESPIKLIGVGRDRDEARAPAIIEVNGVRTGFLAYCSVPIRNNTLTRLPRLESRTGRPHTVVCVPIAKIRSDAGAQPSASRAARSHAGIGTSLRLRQPYRATISGRDGTGPLWAGMFLGSRTEVLANGGCVFDGGRLRGWIHPKSDL